MFSKWFSKKTNNKIGFEDILYAIQNRDACILLNTLPSSEQQCLIMGTLLMENEETMINTLLQNNHHTQPILIYGKHNCDAKPDEKYIQLTNLGFTHVYVYHGGLFEWLLLQDIYGSDFQTTNKVRDILQYRPKPLLKTPRLTF
jgi:hypothetical protein